MVILQFLPCQIGLKYFRAASKEKLLRVQHTSLGCECNARNDIWCLHVNNLKLKGFIAFKLLKIKLKFL